MAKQSIHGFYFHKKQVTQLEWCPINENILVSGSDDDKIYIWDSSHVGMEQGRQDYEDGPPELIFPHMYHSSIIEDIQWIPASVGAAKNFNMCLASIETNMQMQVW